MKYGEWFREQDRRRERERQVNRIQNECGIDRVVAKALRGQVVQDIERERQVDRAVRAAMGIHWPIKASRNIILKNALKFSAVFPNEMESIRQAWRLQHAS